MSDTFTLIKAERPTSKRGTGAVGFDWVAKIGPTLKAEPGVNFLLKAFPVDEKTKAASLAANVSNHMWNKDTLHEYSIVARTNDDGTQGVHAMYVGPMSAKRREELVAQRLARTPITRRPGYVAPEGDGGPVAEAQTPAQRAKAAAGKS